MTIETYIRTLAKSSYWQEVYRSSKECSGIYLFENNTGISGLQYSFLYWLRVYDLLYTELNNKNWQNLDIYVIKNDDRCDAFLYWRSKELEKQERDQKRQDKKMSNKKGSRNFNIYKGKK